LSRSVSGQRREIDLECEPLPDGSERFPFRQLYDWLVAIPATRLLEQGLLLRGDAIDMIFDARDAQVGAPDRCESSAQ